MVYGALLVVVITFMPGGLVGAWRRIRQSRPWQLRRA
jgi:ABC-type branched-subunit amino acid transport system permease subunit